MLPASIRRLSYNPAVRNVFQHLRLGGFARRVYCSLLSSSGKLEVSCLGIHTIFQAHNYQQLAFVDNIVTSEQPIIQSTLSSLARGDVFLDVGSHYGIYSVLASKLVGLPGRVIAVEPHPATFDVLRGNLACNHCDNVHLMNVAFSDRSGPLALTYNPHGSHVQRAFDSASSVHTVEAVAGDQALSGLPAPNAVKIDVEGHEFAVLCGLQTTLSASSCRLLCVEIHPRLLPSGVQPNNIVEFMRNCGFIISNESVRGSEVHIIATRPAGSVSPPLSSKI
jgi:FkbM family methyltransferase